MSTSPSSPTPAPLADDDDDLLVLSRHLSWFAQREHRYVYHDLHGWLLEVGPVLAEVLAGLSGDTPVTRAALLADRDDADALRAALDELVEHDILVEPGCDELERLLERVPVKARWRVVYHAGEARRIAVVARSPQSPIQELELEPAQVLLWDAIDGERSVLELARARLEDPLGQRPPPDAPEVLALARSLAAQIAAWTHSEVQLTRTSLVPLSFYRRGALPPYLESTMPFARVEGPAATLPEAPAVIELADYHTDVIAAPMLQFDEIETTLSHLFRVAHPALGGLSYAASFVDALLERGLLGDSTREVLEVGGGVGFFAEGFLSRLEARAPAVLAQLRYRVLDLSPALRRSQAARLERFGARAAVVAGDGEHLEGIAPGSLDLVVSNEVIADFRSAWLERADDDDEPGEGWEDPDAMLEALEEDEPASEAPALRGCAEATALIARCGLALGDAPRRFLFNLGAAHFVEAIARALRPGGAAVLTEFGDRWRYPVESTHLDHAEVSIHFGHLLEVARACGLDAELVDVPDLIGLDGAHTTLATTRTFYRNLCALAAARGARLEKIAYTPQLLAEACAGTDFDPQRVEALDWRPLETRVHGLVPREFKALVLRRAR